ncbi:hypothetical protein ACQKO6_17655 [Pseudomonas monteilii]
MSSALTMIKTNDTGLLTLEQLPAFRQYLTDNKCRVRKGNEHQVLFVGTSAGWAPIQKGAGGHIKTPVALRPVIEDFTKSPAERSRQLARQIGRTSKVPVAEGVCAVPVVVVPVEPHQVNVTCRLSNPELPADVEVIEKATIETWPEDGLAGPRNFHVLPLGVMPPTHIDYGADQDKTVVSRLTTSGAADSNKPQVAAGVDDASKRVESADLEHLQDLRDDFAIHCPLPMFEGEDLAAFAVRRWAYADQMMASRLPQYAD